MPPPARQHSRCDGAVAATMEPPSSMRSSTCGYLGEYGVAAPGPAGGGLFWEGRGEELTHLQAAALRLSWGLGAQRRVGRLSTVMRGLADDLLCMVAEMLRSRALVVSDVAALRAAAVGAAGVIELDWARGAFELGAAPLTIPRPVRLVSSAGGQAVLLGGTHSGEALSIVEVAPGGRLTLEGLAVVPGTDGARVVARLPSCRCLAAICPPCKAYCGHNN